MGDQAWEQDVRRNGSQAGTGRSMANRQLKAAGSKPASYSQKSSGTKQAFKLGRRGIHSYSRRYVVMSVEYRRGSLLDTEIDIVGNLLKLTIVSSRY